MRNPIFIVFLNMRFVLFKLIFGIFILIGLTNCCDQNTPRPDPIEDVAVNFDTTLPGGMLKSDFDTVLVKFKGIYLDSFKGNIFRYYFDTFFSDKQGGFIYHNIKTKNVGLGLLRNNADTLTVYAGRKSFEFCNAVFIQSQPDKCKDKAKIEKHELKLNGVTFNLENRNHISGHIEIKNGIFIVK